VLKWVAGAPYSRGSGTPKDVLAAILAGLAPLASLIRTGVVVMGKPDDGHAAWRGVMGTAERMEEARAHPEIVAHALAGLAGLASETGAFPIPEGVKRYFKQTSADPIGWDFSLLKLTVNNALAMRANEQVFFTMHAALVAVARVAGR